MTFCDCPESEAAGMMAMFTTTLLRLQICTVNAPWPRPHIVTCAHCNKVLKGINYGSARVGAFVLRFDS
jgi:hypothetical protein